MAQGRTSLIENSTQVKFILNCMEKNLSIPMIQKLLAERGFNVSLPTLRKYIQKVRKEGLEINQFREETQATALAVNEKIKDIKSMANIFSRRNDMIQVLLDRRAKLLDYASEGPRTEHLLKELYILKSLLKINAEIMRKEDYIAATTIIDGLERYIPANFLDNKCYPSLEDMVRKYTMDVHELCKYIEQWTSKYEVESLMEKLCEGLTKAAVNTFGPLLKDKTEAQRGQYINKFLGEVDKLMNDIRAYQLELEETKNG